jgi:YVTN family beta-propeller protein
VALFELVGIIVRQFLPGLHIPDRLDPDSPFLDHGVAVGIAGVIDESGVVALERGIDHDVIVDGEEERVMPVAIVWIAGIGLLRREALPGVFDQARALGNELGGKGAGWVTLTPDGKTAYVANPVTNDVSVVDIASMKETTRIPVGFVPKRNATVSLQ